MYCSPQSCTLPSQHTIVEAPAVQRLPASCILRRLFLPQDCPVWSLHLWWCHLASRIWWQVLSGLQGVKTPQSHHPLPLLPVSCLIVCALFVCHREEIVTTWTVTLPCSSPYIPCHVGVHENCFGFMLQRLQLCLALGVLFMCCKSVCLFTFFVSCLAVFQS